MRPKHYHAITAKYLGPTNSSGSRILLRSERFGDRRITPYDYGAADMQDNCLTILKEWGYKVEGSAESKEGYIFLTSTFLPLTKKAREADRLLRDSL